MMCGLQHVHDAYASFSAAAFSTDLGTALTP
jgi:hypothetical protein